MSFTHQEFLEELPYLEKLCARLTRSAQIAEELYHDTLVLALEQQAHYENGQSLESWMANLARSRHTEMRVQDMNAVSIFPLTDYFSSQTRTFYISTDDGYSYEDTARDAGQCLAGVVTCNARGRVALPAYLPEDPEVMSYWNLEI